MTDASGVPTNPDNIPTYNTSADAPSGLGFNTAMAQIQSIITNLKAGTLASGKLALAALNATGVASASTFLRGDGTWSSAGVKTTTSTIAGGPPGSPADGDIWIATAVDASGTRWAFQYNAGSASSSKWEFIGGPPITVHVETTQSTTAGSFADLATVGPSFTVARAGDYITTFGYAAQFPTASGGVAEATVAKNGVIFGDTAFLNGANFATFLGSVVGNNIPTTFAAADVMKLMYLISNGVSMSFQNRWLQVTPVRIS